MGPLIICLYPNPNRKWRSWTRQSALLMTCCHAVINEQSRCSHRNSARQFRHTVRDVLDPTLLWGIDNARSGPPKPFLQCNAFCTCTTEDIVFVRHDGACTQAYSKESERHCTSHTMLCLLVGLINCSSPGNILSLRKDDNAPVGAQTINHNKLVTWSEWRRCSQTVVCSVM